MAKPYISSAHVEYSNQKPVNFKELSPEINIIFGANEAGKSRFREFISWVLFANDNKFHTDKTKKISALYKSAFYLVDETTTGEITINADGKENIISQKLNGMVLENKLSPKGTDFRHLLTDGISLENYNTIYSLSLDEISKSKSDELITDKSKLEYVFGDVQAKTAVSPSVLIKTLEDRAKSFLSASKEVENSITKTLKKLEDNKKEIKFLKTEQKLNINIDTNLSELIDKNETDTLELEKLLERKQHLQSLASGYELFEKYNNLVNQNSASYNLAAVNEANEIAILLRQSKDIQKYENEIAGLEKLLEKNTKNINSLTLKLDETLPPDNANQYILSHEFESIIEDEIASRSNTKLNTERINSEIKGLKSKNELLKKQAKKSKPSTMPSEDRNKSKLFLYLSAAFAIISIAGIFINPIIAAVGLTATIFSAITFFVNNKEHDPHAQIDTQHLDIELEHNELEISSKQNELFDIESILQLGNEKYVAGCQQAGFQDPIEPKHIQKYIKDFQTLTNAHGELESIRNNIKKLQLKIKDYYLDLEKVSKSISYAEKDADTFQSVAHAVSWLELIQQYIDEQTDIKNTVNENNLKLKRIENDLSENFESIENVKKIFTDKTKESIDDELFMTSSVAAEKQSEINKTLELIGSLKNEQKNASKSTQIQDLSLEQETLKEELSNLHSQYVVAFTTHKIAESAFKKWQEEFQPEVTKTASELFSRLTKNFWASTQTDFEQARSKNQLSLFNVKNENTNLESVKLSRGASEQLYLSFRLAVMKTNQRAKSAPAMFDDISVNFDKERFKTLIPIIEEISESRQVFYFTCHEWVRDALAEMSNAKVFNL